MPEGLQFPTREESVVPDLLAARAAEDPDKPFVLFENEQWTRAETAREAWRAGNGFQRLGVAMGDYISSWMPTGPDVLRTWFGANAAGAVYAPLNLAARGSYLEHTLNLAESKVLVADHELVERLPGLSLPHLEQVVVVGGPSPVQLPWETVAMEEVLDGTAETRPELPRCSSQCR